MTAVATGVHAFTIALGDGPGLVDRAEGIYALCNDASIWSEGPMVFVGFDREAESLGDAIGSAIKDVERAGFTVARVEIEAPEPVR